MEGLSYENITFEENVRNIISNVRLKWITRLLSALSEDMFVYV